MSTLSEFNRDKINLESSMFSRLKTIIETPFYGNNVVNVENLKDAYELAKTSPGTIITSQSIEEPQSLGLNPGSKVLIFNDGAVTGRSAAARRIVGEKGVNCSDLDKKVKDAIYYTKNKKLYHAQVLIGLDEDFMVRAHLLIPEGEENILYNWMLNFQEFNNYYKSKYVNSKKIENEADIYVFSDPQWENDEHPLGLTYFDSEHNCAAILGMKYFGEHKKGTLTLAWAIANRIGYASCHGGLKQFSSKNINPFTLAVFGLSGSGKSTITHEKHNGKYEIKILHDDAFIINIKEKFFIALEPSHFDKTQNYPPNCKDNKYLLTMQNVGATLDINGDIVPVTEDIRNGNGRAIKSKLWSENRVDRISDKISAICWVMKDPVFPPIVHISDPMISSLMGAGLATKRSTAERIEGLNDLDRLVFEPYANPFRTYPLLEDYEKFLSLFENGVDCYILNTGTFFDRDISKQVTIKAIEQIVEGNKKFVNLLDLNCFKYLPIYGYEVVNNQEYRQKLRKSMYDRLEFFKNLTEYNKLPESAIKHFETLIEQL